MRNLPIQLGILMLVYLVFAVVAIWRALHGGGIDLFTFGVVPVFIGIAIRAPWAAIIFKLYVLLQTLGFAALAVTAILAYQITPEDVKVVIDGINIPMPWVVSGIIVLLGFQYWVAFSASTKAFLLKSPATTV
ncbi:hypothetical protein [Shewanella gelidii]|uniref:Uncharacterized protein n=1 Tax=Shewanella gelidii TaxID=1642821 RepID=A0A917NCI7_9GAMM|nr:hypothetical protein [Shewanella gelidii]MCL1098814.1 hypothetical protein [Shewanella gelidii]GGI87490.1 hypothetical protein GCM10009332_25920 [Shewanella gelidii]